jgi:hypothetical protein
VQQGGALAAGQSKTAVGTLTVNGNVTLNAEATLRIRIRSAATRTSCDAFRVSGTVKMTSPVIEVTELSTRYEIADDAELQVFDASGTITITGTVTMLPERPKAGCLWDISALATEGILRVVSDPTGIREIEGTDASKGKWYDLSGRPVQRPKHGLYIKDGKKVYIE